MSILQTWAINDIINAGTVTRAVLQQIADVEGSGTGTWTCGGVSCPPFCMEYSVHGEQSERYYTNSWNACFLCIPPSQRAWCLCWRSTAPMRAGRPGFDAFRPAALPRHRPWKPSSGLAIPAAPAGLRQLGLALANFVTS